MKEYFSINIWQQSSQQRKRRRRRRGRGGEGGIRAGRRSGELEERRGVGGKS